MATQAVVSATFDSALHLQKLATFSQMRALAWDGDVLYASRGYSLLKMPVTSGRFEWAPVGNYRPWWRELTSRSILTYRLVRDGFHALAIHPGGNLIAAVPGAIVTLGIGESEFRVSHRILRGTRPLHITATPDGRSYSGRVSSIILGAMKFTSTRRMTQGRVGTWLIPSPSIPFDTFTTSSTTAGGSASGFLPVTMGKNAGF